MGWRLDSNEQEGVYLVLFRGEGKGLKTGDEPRVVTVNEMQQ